MTRRPRSRPAQRQVGRPGAAAQGGPADDHRPGPLRRRHGRPGHALHGRRPLARGARQDHLDRRLRRALALPGVHGVFTGEDLDLAAPACRWRGCRRASRSRRPSTGRWPRARSSTSARASRSSSATTSTRVVDAAEQVLVEYDPLPVVVDPEKALEDGSALVHEDLGTNKIARVVDRRRRHGRGVGRGRRRRSSGGSSTTARPARRSSRASASPTTAAAQLTLHLDEPEPAPDPPLHGGRARACPRTASA